jgi:hypothetical protein
VRIRAANRRDPLLVTIPTVFGHLSGQVFFIENPGYFQPPCFRRPEMLVVGSSDLFVWVFPVAMPDTQKTSQTTVRVDFPGFFGVIKRVNRTQKGNLVRIRAFCVITISAFTAVVFQFHLIKSPFNTFDQDVFTLRLLVPIQILRPYLQAPVSVAIADPGQIIIGAALIDTLEIENHVHQVIIFSNLKIFLKFRS